MPRGVKGSGKAQKVVEKKTEKKVRKPYPTKEARIAMADQQIARLTKLNAARTALVEKTQKILAERQETLAKSTAALEKAVAKKERLITAQNKLTQAPKAKLTMEERKARMAAGRAAKKAENEKYAALAAALKNSGKSVDELLAELKG